MCARVHARRRVREYVRVRARVHARRRVTERERELFDDGMSVLQSQMLSIAGGTKRDMDKDENLRNIRN